MRSPAVVVLFAVLSLTASPLTAESPPSGADLAEEVRGIRRSLDRLTQMLEQMQLNHEVDLMFKRIEMRERRLAPLERRLRSAENDARSHEDQLKSLERIKEQQEEALQQEIQDGKDSPQSGTRNMLEDIQRSQITAEERLERAQMQVQLLENELASGRRDLEVLDDMLIDLLEEQER
jgi:hypothetical protein